MTFRCVLTLSLILSVESAIRDGSGLGSLPQQLSAKQAEIVTVRFCDLVRNPSNYDAKVLQVRATWLSRLDSSLLCYQGCNQCLRPVLDCDTEEKCVAMRKEFNRHSRFDGEETSRVDAFFIGRILFESANAPKGEAGNQFRIEQIKYVRRIPRLLHSKKRSQFSSTMRK